jgi:putative DNA primase/helicase
MSNHPTPSHAGTRTPTLQRCVGYSLTGQTSEHALFLLYGKGANGKSTFLESIRHILGDYAQTADFSSFMVSKNQTIRNDIAKLNGARLVTATESESGKRMSEAIVKQLTGGDTVSARFLYSEAFEFVPQFSGPVGVCYAERAVTVMNSFACCSSRLCI